MLRRLKSFAPSVDAGDSAVLCATQVFGSPGGIQTYMRLVAGALADRDRLGGIVSLMDRPGAAAESMREFRTANFRASQGSKPRFAFQCAANSGFGDTLIFGHPALAPIGLVLSALGLVDRYAVIMHGREAWKPLPGPVRLGLQRADVLICTTPFTAGVVAEHNGLDVDRIDILPLAVEPGRFDTDFHREFEDLEADEPLRIVGLGRVGKPVRYKGFDDVIRAVGRLAERDVPVVYRHVGGGDDMDYLREVAREAGATEHVELLGRLPDEELAREFEGAHVFAMPSSKEGFGLVYLEAMHYELPVIASPEGGAQYVVDHESNGLLCEWRSPGAIAEALERLRERRLRENLGRQGREDVETTYSYEQFRRGLLEILEK